LEAISQTSKKDDTSGVNSVNRVKKDWKEGEKRRPQFGKKNAGERIQPEKECRLGTTRTIQEKSKIGGRLINWVGVCNEEKKGGGGKRKRTMLWGKTKVNSEVPRNGLSMQKADTKSRLPKGAVTDIW